MRFLQSHVLLQETPHGSHVLEVLQSHIHIQHAAFMYIYS